MGIHKQMIAMRLGLASLLVLALPAALAGQQPDRSAPPELGPPPGLELPEMQRLELSNGVSVLLLEKHNVPLAQVNLVVRAGSALDPKGAAGLASLAADMLDEGAGGRGALELADAIDFLGADISIFSGEHSTTLALHTPVSRLDAALGLLSDVAMRPDFPEEELERKRLERLTQLLQARDEPRAIAAALFDRTLYGEDHPYGRSPDEASLRGMRADDLEEYHRTYFRPNNSFFVVVGDVTASEIEPKLEALFGGWEPGRIPVSDAPMVEQVERREVFLVDKPDAAQSEIRIGRIGVPRLTEDYDAIVVMNTILGGSFASRLNQNLREEHGYTYGARSFFDFRPLPGPFLAGAAVQTAVTDKALVEFMKELQGILEPVSDDELTRAKNFVALRFPSRFQTVSGIAFQLAELELYGLPDDYFNQYVNRILAVSRDDVQRVAGKYLDPERISIIVVGDRQVIEEGVRGLDLGQIHLLTVEDVLGQPPVVGGAG